MPVIEVSLYDIIKYIGDRSRPLIEGEAVFKAGHIILCGLSNENSETIKSLCLQTSGLTSPPHEVAIVINKDVSKWKCVCSCKAGLSGFCKHIVATLIYVNKNEQLEIVSCTDLAQKWGKEKQGIEETHKAEPFKNFCHPLAKRKKLSFKSAVELEEENFALLATGVADSALTRFLGRVQNRQKIDSMDHIKSIFTHIEKSKFLNELMLTVIIELYPLKSCCLEILNFLSACNVLEVANYEQGSSLWLKERQLRITGSTCYSIFTFSKDNEWDNRAKKKFFPKGFENKYTNHGKKYEGKALETFKKNNSTVEIVTTGLIVSKAFPWLAYSPDGIIFENNIPTKLIEVKCPYIGKEKDPTSFLDSCDYLIKTDNGVELKKHHNYFGQVELGMALLGLDATKFIIYSSHSNTYLEVDIGFDEIFAKELIKKITDNYFVNMLHIYCLNKDSINY